MGPMRACESGLTRGGWPGKRLTGRASATRILRVYRAQGGCKSRPGGLWVMFNVGLF